MSAPEFLLETQPLDLAIFKGVTFKISNQVLDADMAPIPLEDGTTSTFTITAGQETHTYTTTPEITFDLPNGFTYVTLSATETGTFGFTVGTYRWLLNRVDGTVIRLQSGQVTLL